MLRRVGTNSCSRPAAALARAPDEKLCSSLSAGVAKCDRYKQNKVMRRLRSTDHCGEGAAMTVEENKALVQKVFEGLNTGSSAGMDEVCAPGYQLHFPLSPVPLDLQSAKGFFQAM